MKKYSFWKDLTFYFLIEAYADVILRAGGEIQTLRQASGQATGSSQALAELREEADKLSEQFQHRLDHAFITPLDKEDLLEIFQQLDGVLEAIEGAARGLGSAGLEGVKADLDPLVVKVQEAANSTFELASSLRHGYKHGALPASMSAVHRVKKEADGLYDAALKGLGASSGMSLQAAVISKEAYDRLRAVYQSSADLARLVARVLVKYA